MWAVSAGDSEWGACSGLLLVPAGVAMLVCAPRALRGAPERRRWERWARRVVGALGVVASLMWLVMPVGVALYATGKRRTPVPAGASGIPHQDVN